MVTQIRSDLWQTPSFSPFPGLTTHSYLWAPANGENVLFYSPGDTADFDALAELGGVAHQYLSHQDEAGPMLRRVAERFGARLHAPAADLGGIEEHATPDVLLAERGSDAQRVEVIPTPGHTPGSTSFVVTGDGEERYLFTGDTLFRGASGNWHAGFIPGMSDADDLRAALAVLADTAPDLVASSAFAGESGVHAVTPGEWRIAIEQALAGLPAPSGASSSAP